MFPAAHLSNESHWLRSHQPVSADGKTASPCFVHARRFFSVLDAFSLQSVSFFFFFYASCMISILFSRFDFIFYSYSLLFFVLYGFQFRSDGRFLIRQDCIESMRKMRNCLLVRAGAIEFFFSFQMNGRIESKTRRAETCQFSSAPIS